MELQKDAGDHVRNEKVLQRVKAERNTLRRIKRRNAN
jgi:hypothetical protein